MWHFCLVCLIFSVHKCIDATSAWNTVVSLLRLIGNITLGCYSYILAPTPYSVLDSSVYLDRGAFFQFYLIGSTTVNLLLNKYGRKLIQIKSGPKTDWQQSSEAETSYTKNSMSISYLSNSGFVSFLHRQVIHKFIYLSLMYLFVFILILSLTFQTFSSSS